jgi:chaperonin GroEL
VQPSNGIPPREIKKLKYGAEARATVLAGVEKLYEGVSSTYGPAANNVLQGMVYGDPVLTRDGVTVAKRIILEDRAEDDAAKVMRQASEKTNKTAGDGTTATIVLGYHLLKAANQRVVAGENPMKLKAQMVTDSRKVIEYIKTHSMSAKKHLLAVATVSSGDKNIGALVADTLEDIGLEGGITIREQSYPTVDVEKINGYYFSKGFFALNQQVEWEKPHVLVSSKPLVTAMDILPIIQYVNQNPQPRLVIIGEVRGDALQLLLTNSATAADQQGRPIPFEAVVIPPSAYGDEAKLIMEDIGIYTGASVFTEAIKDFDPSFLGTAGRVQVNQDRAIIFNGGGDAEKISERAAEIKVNIEKETDAYVKDNLEQRYSKLVGKIAIVNVGASTPTEMEELKFRVEDAIEATKSAMADGVVPGGATMLARASGFGPHGIVGLSDISDMFKVALRETFKKLYDNAGESPDYRLKQVQASKLGFGFNLREMTEEPIDLKAAGIWDATRAVTQTIENATSAAGALLTVGALVTPLDDAQSSA